MQECRHIVRLAVIADDDNLSLPSDPISADILLSLGDIHPATIERAADFFMRNELLPYAAIMTRHASRCLVGWSLCTEEPLKPLVFALEA